MDDYRDVLGGILDILGHLTANGMEVVIARDYATRSQWRIEARRVGRQAIIATGPKLLDTLNAVDVKFTSEQRAVRSKGRG